MGVARISSGGGDTFRKFSKKLLGKSRKMNYFNIFKRILQTMRQFFARLDEKHNFMEILRKFLKKIAKNALFYHIFQKI